VKISVSVSLVLLAFFLKIYCNLCCFLAGPISFASEQISCHFLDDIQIKLRGEASAAL
jgi:hypothetical protein